MTMNRVSYFFGDSIVNTVLLEVVLISSCVLGDTCVAFVSHRLNDYLWLRAGMDTGTHGLIALWSWALVENSHFDRYKIINCLFCALLAVGVDLDHFYAAKSLDIKNALSLPDRPPFHLSTIIPVVSTVLWILGAILQTNRLKTLSLVFFTAVFTHHLRDATRRGFWLSPFTNSPAVPYWVYIAVTMWLPFLVRVFYMSLRPSFNVLESEKEVEIVLQD